MAEQKTSGYDYWPIARERLIWVAKPVMLVCFTLWALHPATTAAEDLDRNALLGFLFGAMYGVVVHLEVFKKYLVLRRLTGRNRKNRVPEEYYFGTIKERLFLAKD